MAVRGRARFRLEAKETDSLPTFFQDQITVISNLLNTPGNHSTLARTSRIDEKRFALQKVGPVRSTRLLCIEYSGPENCVQSVASNAANVVIAFYSTNRPSWGVTFVDSACFIEPSPWERLQDAVASMWHWSKAEVGR
jgi:hypothetical protein